jgi:hypothetical protein
MRASAAKIRPRQSTPETQLEDCDEANSRITNYFIVFATPPCPGLSLSR